MHPIVGGFPDAEDAYRHERISASFRDHAASPHRFFYRWHKHQSDQVAAPEPPAAA